MKTSLDYIMKGISYLTILLLLHYKSQYFQNFSCNCQPSKPSTHSMFNVENSPKNIFIAETTKTLIQSSPDFISEDNLYKKVATDQTNNPQTEPKIQLTIDKLNPNQFFVAFLMNGTLQPDSNENETHHITMDKNYNNSDNTSTLQLQDISVNRASAMPNHLNHSFLIISVDLNITDENSTTIRNFTKSIILPDTVDPSSLNHSTSLDVSIEGMVPLTFKVHNNKTKHTDSTDSIPTTNKRDDYTVVYRNSSSFYITPIYFSRVSFSDPTTQTTTLSPVRKCKSSDIKAIIVLRTYFITFVVITTMVLLLGSISMFGKYYVESKRKLSYNCWMDKEKDDKKILRNNTTCL